MGKTMDKKYLILVDGKLATRRMTLWFALKDKKELEAKGYQRVSVAEEITLKEITQ